MSTHDPLAYGSAAIVMLLVGLGAAALPALRSTRVDPAETLRLE